MTIQLSWYLEKRVAVVEFGGHISEDELRTYDTAVISMLNTSRSAFVIVDATPLKRLPGVTSMSRMTWPLHPSLEAVVVLNMAQPSLRQTMTLMAQWFNHDIHFCDSLSEAIALLRSIDPALPDDAGTV